MDNKMLILSILTILCAIGILIFQINVGGNPFLIGLGFGIGSICLLIAVFIEALLPN